MTASEDRVVLMHQDRPVDPWEWDPESWTEDEAVHYREMLDEGQLVKQSGEPLGEREARWTRDLLLGKASYNHQVQPGLRHLSGSKGRRFLIEPFWPWGTFPMLAGTYKAGKTTLVVDLVAALLSADRPFLGRFPVAMTDDERRDGIVLINAETPREDFENALLLAGVDPGDERLFIYHLDDLGGPTLFDLTVRERFDYWDRELMQCNDCDDGFFWTPSVVILDGLTAVVGDPSRYGDWFPEFKRLMKITDVPNALVTGHTAAGTTHLYEATKSMAGPDGVWSYTSDRPDDPNSARHFQVLPRMGGAAISRTRVKPGEDGRLSAAAPKTEEPRTPEEAKGAVRSSDGEPDEHESYVLSKLGELPEGERFTTRITGRGREGEVRRAALHRLREGGRVASRAAPGGRGELWSLVVSSSGNTPV